MSNAPPTRGLMGSFEPNYDSEGNITDFATGKTLKNPGPEEPVRQWYEHILVNDYGYDKNQLDIEISISMGSSTKHADIGVYESDRKKSLKILVEAKKPERTEGVDQLESYLEASGVSLGVWTNGDGVDYFHHPEPTKFEPISDVPKSGETLASMDSRITRNDLNPASDLISVFEQCEDEIVAHQGGADAFDELFKIILTKLYDEIENLHSEDSVSQFRAGPRENPSTVAERVRIQFQGSNDKDVLGAKRKYSDVFRGDEDIVLNDENIKRVVSTMQNIDFMNTNMDTLGAGFEALVPEQMKNDKGQYFTPRHVIRMTTELADPKRYEDLLDPACGSGGFLVYVMRHLRNKLASERGGDTNADQQALQLIQEYAADRAHGLDYDQRLVRVAKAYMVIWGDGRTNIRHVHDSLRYFDWPGDIQTLVQEDSFDVILTNPPFAGDTDIQNSRDHFDLGTRNGDPLDTQEKDILFLERCIKHLKPGGRLGIVLPKGDLDERGKSYFRDYIRRHTYIRAVIGLHENTFLPYAGETTAVLLLEKKKEPGPVDDDDYQVFMAVSDRPGKNNEGEHTYVRDDQGELIADEDGEAILDTDLYTIADEFHSNDEPSIGYSVAYSDLRDRLNAEYYHPKYDQVQQQLEEVDMVVTIQDILDPDKSYPLVNGKDISSLSATGKREYVEEGTPYLRAGDLKRNDIDIRGSNKVEYTSDDVKQNQRLHVGDILFSRKGTTGRAAAVTEREVDSLIASEVMKLQLRGAVMDPDGEMRNVDPFYISAYLNSKYGRMQIERHLTGSISQGINQHDLKSVRIPLPSEDIQAEIADPYREVRQMISEVEQLNDEALERCNIIGEADAPTDSSS